MAFSATSGQATSGTGRFVLPRKQALRAGRPRPAGAPPPTSYQLEHLAPTLLVGSLGLLLAASIDDRQRRQRLAQVGPQSSAFRAREACARHRLAAYLSRHPAPRTLGELFAGSARRRRLRALFLAEPDLGTAITVVVMLGGVLVVSGAPARLPASAGALSATRPRPPGSSRSRRARLLSFLNPWDDPQGAGYQTVQAMIGLGSGGIFGVGLGEGISKNFYLPEAHTDMIFAIVGEELGLVGTTALIGAYAAFGYAGFRLALGCKDPFGKRSPPGSRHCSRPGADQCCGRHGRRAADGHHPAVRLLTAARASVSSPASASSLTSRATMAEQPGPRCLIAAGGTAGHVLPAIAVGEALRDRGSRDVRRVAGSR